MKKTCIILIVCLMVLVIGYQGLKFIARSGGSHHDAEFYQFKKSKEDLILAINNFKEINPNYKVITSQPSGELEEVTDGYNYYTYYCLFYLKDKDIVLNCIVLQRPNDSYSRIGLFSMSRSTRFSEWHKINTSDLGWMENREIKKAFETEILDKLGEWRKLYLWE